LLPPKKVLREGNAVVSVPSRQAFDFVKRDFAETDREVPVLHLGNLSEPAEAVRPRAPEAAGREDPRQDSWIIGEVNCVLGHVIPGGVPMVAK